jgi:hypothetical protein
VESKAIELILGPIRYSYMRSHYPGNTPERVAYIAKALHEEWDWQEWRRKLLEQAQADLDVWQDLADPQ